MFGLQPIAREISLDFNNQSEPSNNKYNMLCRGVRPGYLIK